MLIEFRASDRLLGMKALGIYRKGIETARTACDKVYVSTLPLQAADAEAEGVEQWLHDALEDMNLGETREKNLSIEDALAFRTAVSVYLGQLGKLAEKQTDLLVPIEDTNALMSQLQSLADRLGGQGDLGAVVMGAVADRLAATPPEPGDDETTTATFSSGGRTVKVNGSQLERAANGGKRRGRKE